MRPRSALTRPPSAGRLHVSSEQRFAHRFAHVMREKVSMFRHAANLPDAPPAPAEAAALTGETDEEYYSVLRNREDLQRTILHDLACCSTRIPSASAPRLPPLSIDFSATNAFMLSENTILLESWKDDDGVVVTDEPRLLYRLPSTVAAAAADNRGVNDHVALPPAWQQFAQGALLVASLEVAGVFPSIGLRHHVTLHELTSPLPRVNHETPVFRRLGHHSATYAAVSSPAAEGYSGRGGSEGRGACLPAPPLSSLPKQQQQPGGSNAMTIVASVDFSPSKAASVRWVGPAARRVLTAIAEPFSDAELFQWFYLQLTLRSLVGAILDPAVFGEPGSTRWDLIRKHSSGHQGLAFEFPQDPRRFLAFPPKSSLLTLLPLEGIRFVSDDSDNNGSAGVAAPMHLLGCAAADVLPCVSRFGLHVLESWACRVSIKTRQDATVALQQLFDMFGQLYTVSREEVLNFTVAPKVCLCGRRALVRLRKHPWLSPHVGAIPDAPASLARPTRPVAAKTTTTSTGATPVPREPTPPAAPVTPLAVDAVVQMPLTHPSLVDTLRERWLRYVSTGNIAVFEETDAEKHSLTYHSVLGRGGSGIVYAAQYRHPTTDMTLSVAVKLFIIPDGMTHEEYVRECLTDVAFYSIHNEMHDRRICPAAQAMDFRILSERPLDVPVSDWTTVLHHADPATAKVCLLVSDRVAATAGRFLTSADEEFDPAFETLQNIPLDDLQVFQFTYMQLVTRIAHSYVIHDMMISGQLRGDNLGLLRVTSDRSREISYHRVCSERSGSAASGSAVILPASHSVWFRGPIRDGAQWEQPQPFAEGTQHKQRHCPFRYLRFPCDENSSFVVCIDVGQGAQAQVDRLYREKHLIGNPIVDSCIVDDGLGRFWESDRLFAAGVEAKSTNGKAILKWLSQEKVATTDDARRLLVELFDRFGELGYSVTNDEDLPQKSDQAFVWTGDFEALRLWNQGSYLSALR